MEGWLLLDVVVWKSSSILKLLTSEDKSLLIGWDSLLVLDLGLDILNGIWWLNIKGDGLTGKGLDEDLHTSSKSEDQVKGWLLLDVVVAEGSAVFKLLSGEDKSLLIGWDSLLILDLGFHVLDGVGWFDVEGDGLTGEGLDEDLHTSSKSEDQMESRLLLDVVVTEGSAVFKLFSGEDESLLIGWDSFLVLDLGLDVFNGVRGLNVQSDCFASKGLNEDLHFCLYVY